MGCVSSSPAGTPPSPHTLTTTKVAKQKNRRKTLVNVSTKMSLSVVNEVECPSILPSIDEHKKWSERSLRLTASPQTTTTSPKTPPLTPIKHLLSPNENCGVVMSSNKKGIRQLKKRRDTTGRDKMAPAKAKLVSSYFRSPMAYQGSVISTTPEAKMPSSEKKGRGGDNLQGLMDEFSTSPLTSAVNREEKPMSDVPHIVVMEETNQFIRKVSPKYDSSPPPFQLLSPNNFSAERLTAPEIAKAKGTGLPGEEGKENDLGPTWKVSGHHHHENGGPK